MIKYEHNIQMLDVYVLNYYGVIVVFKVAKTTKKFVYIYELGTKRYKDGRTIADYERGSRKPLVVLKNNCFSKTKFRVKPKNNEIPIKVEFESKLWLEAKKYVDWPIVGTVYATLFENYKSTYWEMPKPKEQKDKEDIIYC